MLNTIRDCFGIEKKKYWNNESAFAAAKECTNHTELIEKYSGAYHYLRRNGLVEEATKHFLKKPKNYWDDKENCRKECKKYKTISELKKVNMRCYEGIRINGWVDEFYPDRRQKKSWNEVTILIDTMELIDPKEWTSRPSYIAARKRGIINKIRKARGWERADWTEELIWEDLKNYESYGQWRKLGPPSYRTACKLNIQKEIKENYDWLNKRPISEKIVA